ncbi:MAG: AmmeMemoRadiSam system radical SAM enzyme [Candidatus Bathyarchaeia archaeon]
MPLKLKEELLSFPTVREALLFTPSNGRVVCNLCERRCKIPDGSLGFCKARGNIGGRLYTLVYGDISSISANPIEKKPFFHFYPGTTALTVGTWGCNFTCPWCQNWEISKFEANPAKANYIPPERLIELTLKCHCRGISISFNEPTLLFEYSLDLFKLAREKGLYTNYVSNGYMTSEALKMLEAGMDAIKIDVKGDTQTVRRYCGAEVDKVWSRAEEAKKMEVHVEIVALLIPGVNDSEASIKGVAWNVLERLGRDTPLHFTRYWPSYKFNNMPTPIETVERACKLAREIGLNYVYVGNVAGHRYENTYCPRCDVLLIERRGIQLLRNMLTNGACWNCGLKIPIVR